jgi:hypothetical protein
MIYGLDVSKWNSSTPDLAGFDFLIARACYGTLNDDFDTTNDNRTYRAHIANARAAGLLTGAYCFGRNVESPEAQADALLAAAGDVECLVLDNEDDMGRGLMSEDQCRRFYARVKAADQYRNRKVGYYGSRSGFPANGYGFDFLWVADYGMNTGKPGTPPAIRWDWWQYTSIPFDKNIYQGTKEELAALLGRQTVTYFTIATSTTGMLVDLPPGTSVFDVARVDDAHLRRKLVGTETRLSVGTLPGEDGNGYICWVGADGVFEFALLTEAGKPYSVTPIDEAAIRADQREKDRTEAGRNLLP